MTDIPDTTRAPPPGDRLSKADWIDHGLKTLAGQGPNALKVGPMAAGLNVSRGSFYWHFRDIGDFRNHLLKAWLDQATEQVIARIEVDAPGAARLKALLHGAFAARRHPHRLAGLFAAEEAIRAWAAEDRAVAAQVAAVDERRIGYIAGQLEAAGVDRARAQSRAAFLYWAYLGQVRAMNDGAGLVDLVAIDDIAALFAR